MQAPKKDRGKKCGQSKAPSKVEEWGDLQSAKHAKHATLSKCCPVVRSDFVKFVWFVVTRESQNDSKPEHRTRPRHRQLHALARASTPHQNEKTSNPFPHSRNLRLVWHRVWQSGVSTWPAPQADEFRHHPMQKPKALLDWTISKDRISIIMKAGFPCLNKPMSGPQCERCGHSLFGPYAVTSQATLSRIVAFRQKLKLKNLTLICLNACAAKPCICRTSIRPWTNNRFLCDLYALVDLNTESVSGHRFSQVFRVS